MKQQEITQQHQRDLNGGSQIPLVPMSLSNNSSHKTKSNENENQNISRKRNVGTRIGDPKLKRSFVIPGFRPYSKKKSERMDENPSQRTDVSHERTIHIDQSIRNPIGSNPSINVIQSITCSGLEQHIEIGSPAEIAMQQLIAPSCGMSQTMTIGQEQGMTQEMEQGMTQRMEQGINQSHDRFAGFGH